MAESFGFLDSQLRMNRAAAREETSIVLPYQHSKTDRGNQSCSTLPLSKSPANEPGPKSPLPLIIELCQSLNAEQISYCHWKSNWKLDHWLAGDGDLDLLIDRADAPSFVSIICGLGFKQAEPDHERVPGITNFYGFDSQASRFVHLHVHYQLVVGHDLTKNYHLPIERLYLETALRPGLIPIPAPELELIVFVFRAVLKYSVLETGFRRAFARSTDSANAVERELAYLEAHTDRSRVYALLPQVVPGLDTAFFETCVGSLRKRSSFLTRVGVRQKLQRHLTTYARRPQKADSLLKICRRVTRVARERLYGRTSRKRFVNGGLLIAVVGGDGAGKTTTLKALDAWLSKKFAIRRFHVGKPPRSPLTIAAIVTLKSRRLVTGAPVQPERQVGTNGTSVFPGYIQLLRWVCAGRDRCRLYLKARRFATNGGIALCDRYPLPQIQLMESPNIGRTVDVNRRDALVRRLLKAETAYYQNMRHPDLLLVLRVDPEIAVARKTTESEHHVRLRSRELWEQDWEGANAYVVNAGQPIEEVVAQLQSIIWARL